MNDSRRRRKTLFPIFFPLLSRCFFPQRRIQSLPCLFHLREFWVYFLSHVTLCIIGLYILPRTEREPGSFYLGPIFAHRNSLHNCVVRNGLEFFLLKISHSDLVFLQALLQAIFVQIREYVGFNFV